MAANDICPLSLREPILGGTREHADHLGASERDEKTTRHSPHARIAEPDPILGEI